jgi:hypothetical protein
MGLDMYMYVGKYESKYTNNENYGKVEFYPEDLKELQNEIEERNFVSKQTLYQVGYWRKANAIHQWFVDRCAEGVDDCRQVYVDREDLQDLLNACEQVLEDHSKAKELLPTCDGFFFGETEYDEWYFKNLEYTRDLINQLLKLDKDYESYYEASW